MLYFSVFFFFYFVDFIISTIYWKKPILCIWRLCFNFPICKPLCCMGGHWGKSYQLSHGQKPEGLCALGSVESSEWEVRMSHLLHRDCANMISWDFPDQTVWLSDSKNSQGKAQTLPFLAAFIWRFWWKQMEEWRSGGVSQSVRFLSSSVSRNSLQMLYSVRGGQVWSGYLRQPEDWPGPTASLEGRRLGLRLEPDLRFSASAA